MKKKSQQQKLYNFMRSNGKITAKQAMNKFGTQNLRARINDLRNEGWNIVSEPNPKDKRTVVYRVIEAA
jgi:hypothetical protein